MHIHKPSEGFVTKSATIETEDGSSISLAAAEIQCSLSLKKTPSSIAKQRDIARKLAALYERGDNEHHLNRNPEKAIQYIAQATSSTPIKQSSVNHKNAMKALSWFNAFRNGGARPDRGLRHPDIEKGFLGPIARKIFQYLGLIYIVEVLYELTRALVEAYKAMPGREAGLSPWGRLKRYFKNLKNAILAIGDDPDRLGRIIHALPWIAINVVLLFTFTAEIYVFWAFTIGFGIDVINEGLKKKGILKPYEDLIKKTLTDLEGIVVGKNITVEQLQLLLANKEHSQLQELEIDIEKSQSLINELDALRSEQKTHERNCKFVKWITNAFFVSMLLFALSVTPGVNFITGGVVIVAAIGFIIASVSPLLKKIGELVYNQFFPSDQKPTTPLTEIPEVKKEKQANTKNILSRLQEAASQHKEISTILSEFKDEIPEVREKLKLTNDREWHAKISLWVQPTGGKTSAEAFRESLLPFVAEEVEEVAPTTPAPT